MEQDDLKSLSTQAESVMTVVIEPVAQRPLNRSFSASEYSELFSDLLVSDDEMFSGGDQNQGPKEPSNQKGNAFLQPIVEESFEKEDSSEHHKESWKDSGKNASKLLGSAMDNSARISWKEP